MSMTASGLEVVESLGGQGFDATINTNPRLQVGYCDLDQAVFNERAERVLLEVTPVIMQHVLPNLEDYEGVWHPSGFMVFLLGVHPELGTMRLHIWPKNGREREDRGIGPLSLHPGYANLFGDYTGEIYDGDAHNHGLFVKSRNIKGYRDHIYLPIRRGPDVIDATVPEWIIERGLDADELVMAGMFRVLNVGYYPDGSVGLVPQFPNVEDTKRAYYELQLLQQREIKQNGFHDLDGEVVHIPTIPDGELGVTITINSPKVPAQLDYISDSQMERPNIYLAGEVRRPVRSRPEVTRSQKIETREQIKDAGLLAA